MHPAQRDVVEPQVRVMSATKLEFTRLGIGLEDIYYARSILVMVQTFKHHVVAIGFLIVYQVIDFVMRTDLHGQAFLTYAAFELFPVIRLRVALDFGLFLLSLPLSETLKMDEC